MFFFFVVKKIDEGLQLILKEKGKIRPLYPPSKQGDRT